MSSEAPKSPWKSSSSPSPGPGPGPGPGPAGVGDTESWPPLSDAQSPTKKLDPEQKMNGRSRQMQKQHPPPFPGPFPYSHMPHNAPDHPRQPFLPPISHNPPPRHFIRPPFPAFLPGPPGAIFYYPAAPPGSFRLPYPPPVFLPHPLPSGPPILPPSELVLRTDIVKQIEYYFSDGNLEGDYYLRSLMDDQGCVAISLIADFKRVKRMTTDVSVILDALKTSSSIEVLGERIRRRDDWSKWVPASAGQTSKETAAENIAGAALSDVKGESKSDNGQGGKDSSLLPPLSDKNKQYQSTADDANNGRENTLADGCSLATAVNQISGRGANSVAKMEFARSVSSKAFQERGTSLKQSGGHEVKIKHPRSRQSGKGKGGMSSILSEKDPDEGSNDFGNTFQFDEELESELKSGMKNHYDPAERIDDEEDENIVDDQDVDKLVIVTRDLPINEGSDTAPRESKPISSEHASAINDLLYYYEQELKSKPSCHKHGNPSNEIKDEISRSPGVASAVSKPKTSEHSSAVSLSEGSRNMNLRRKQHRGSSKQQFLPKQRLFPSNFKNHGNGQHGLAIVSESPPSDSIGFFFGSTPPDNPVFRHSKLSASPRSNVSSSSPPVGSVPKSFPAFQHPSHKLLEENGFKQQL